MRANDFKAASFVWPLSKHRFLFEMKILLLLISTLILIPGILSAQVNGSSALMTAAIYEEEVSGNLDKAINLYLDILKKFPTDRKVVAKSLYHLGLVSEKMGKPKADEYYKKLINDYPDQTEMCTLARARLALYKNVLEHKPGDRKSGLST